jgi:hypothetical protein
MRGTTDDPVIDNRVRWDPTDAGGHVESHFLRAVSPDGDRALWVRHTLLSPRGRAGMGVAESWAIAFERGRPPTAAKSAIPIEQARVDASPFGIAIGPTVLETGRARGAARSSGHALGWDLAFEPLAPPFHPFPLERMYEGAFPKSKTLTPYPDATFDGSFDVDGARWPVAGWRGMQGHNWGRSHAHVYAWGQCNSWAHGADGPAWFEGLTGRVKVGPMLLPWLSLAALHVAGETHRFDGAKAMTTRATDVGWYRWSATLAKGDARLRLDIEAARDDLAGLHYENPDGSMTHCLNSKLARGTVTLTRAGEPEVVLRSDRFALELGTKDHGHGVPMIV